MSHKHQKKLAETNRSDGGGSNTQLQDFQQIDRIANFYSEDVDYNPYEDVDTSTPIAAQNASDATLAPSSASSGEKGVIRRKSLASNKDAVVFGVRGNNSGNTLNSNEEELTSNSAEAESDYANRMENNRPGSLQMHQDPQVMVTAASPPQATNTTTNLLQGYGLVPDGLAVSTNPQNTSNIGSTLSALSAAANWSTVGGIGDGNGSVGTPMLGHHAPLSSSASAGLHPAAGSVTPHTFAQNLPVSPQQLSTPHASTGNDSFDEANSVSVAGGSIANSADLGGFADLDAFGQFQHNPYGRAASGGNNQQQQQLEEQQTLQFQQLQHNQYPRATQHHPPAQRRGVPNFEQTDRYVAEFYYYQDQQEDALLFYNQQRDLQQRHQQQQHSAAMAHSEADSNHHHHHPAPRPVATSSAGESSTQIEESDESGTPSEKNTYSYPFASDVLSVLPSQLSVDLSVKKKTKNHPSGNSAAPHHSNANNDNDATNSFVTAANNIVAHPPRTTANSPTLHQQQQQPASGNNKQPAKSRREGGSNKGPQLNPLQAMKGYFGPAVVHKDDRAKNKKKLTRFLPPPPPSLQAARVMSVCHPTKGGGAEYYEDGKEVAVASLVASQAKLHSPDGKTCIAEGDFAFLTKAPNTSDWGRGGYGATYSATTAEGAPASTFQRLDPSGDGFQNYLQVLMQWYARVARLFGHNDPQNATAYDHLIPPTLVKPRTYLKPAVCLPERYFSQHSVPPCPRPELTFEVSQEDETGLLRVNSMEQFIVWHDAVHTWWERHVQPRTVGYTLHLQLAGGDDAADGNHNVRSNYVQHNGQGSAARGRGGDGGGRGRGGAGGGRGRGQHAGSPPEFHSRGIPVPDMSHYNASPYLYGNNAMPYGLPQHVTPPPPMAYGFNPPGYGPMGGMPAYPYGPYGSPYAFAQPTPELYGNLSSNASTATAYSYLLGQSSATPPYLSPSSK